MVFCRVSELSWIGARWSPVGTIPKERPQTEHFLLWSHKREHCSQVRLHSHFPNSFTNFSNIATISFSLTFPLQSTPVGSVDVHQGRLQKCNDTWERSTRSIYHVGQFALHRTHELGDVHVHLLHLRCSFSPQFGEDHSQTCYSKEFLCTITKHAVMVERSLRQAGADCTEQAVEVLVVTGTYNTSLPLEY